MIKYFGFISLLTTSILSFCYGQSNPPKHFNNDSIHYVVMDVQPDFDNNEYYAPIAVQITSFDTADWNWIKSLTKTEWLNLLNNSQTDWVTNLTLYQYYKKAGGIFRYTKTRDQWIVKGRDTDIGFWKYYLK